MEEQRRTKNQKRKEHAILENKNKKVDRWKNKTRMKTMKAILPFWRTRKNIENSLARIIRPRATIFRSFFHSFKFHQIILQFILIKAHSSDFCNVLLLFSLNFSLLWRLLVNFSKLWRFNWRAKTKKNENGEANKTKWRTRTKTYSFSIPCSKTLLLPTSSHVISLKKVQQLQKRKECHAKQNPTFF